MAAAGAASLSDLTGMYVIEPASVTLPTVLVYSRADGIYQVTLAEEEVTPTAPPPTPTSEVPTSTPGGSAPPPPTASPEPTDRPRRTPRPAAVLP